MISIMIVDDEPFIREGLKVVINWEEHGFQIAAEASNGKEALDILDEKEIDLVIADIRMPIYDGLELIELAKKKKGRRTKYVILSGYNDFEYVRKALNQNVSDYILKPIQKDELINTLKKVKEEILKEQLDEEAIRQLKNNQLRNSIEGLVGGLYSDASLCLIREYFGKLNSLRYVLIRIEKKVIEKCTEDVRAHLQTLLKDSINSNLYYLTETKRLNTNTYDVGVIIYNRSRKIMDKQVTNMIFDQCIKDLDYQYSLYVGIQVENVEELNESYKTAMRATVNQCMINTKDQITYYDELKAKESTKYSVSYEKIERLSRYVKEHNAEKIVPVIEDIYEELKEGLVEPELILINIRYILYNLVDATQNILAKAEQEELLEYLNDTMLADLSYCGDMEGFINFVLELSEYLYQLKNYSSSMVLNKIVKEIDERYAENITLKDLGRKYFINSVYLGQIFKKEIGKSFKEYLNIIRIEKAADFLVKTDERVYAIAEMVGYQKVDYFISKFVSIKGTTPHQYRLKSKC